MVEKNAARGQISTETSREPSSFTTVLCARSYVMHRSPGHERDPAKLALRYSDYSGNLINGQTASGYLTIRFFYASSDGTSATRGTPWTSCSTFVLCSASFSSFSATFINEGLVCTTCCNYRFTSIVSLVPYADFK